MDTTHEDFGTDSIITLRGAVTPTDTRPLRRALVSALDGGSGDLLLDARAVTGFDDQALAALVAARTHGKSRQQRLVVLDVEGGPLATLLRRTGLIFPLPVYADRDDAEAGLAADRQTVALRSGAFGADAVGADKRAAG
ncbi:STAS domain-containing protein [Motilibacter rhizosphaerae]|uniref:STAS domain-containing protein n=1 Tax=Motilibacter rhizosphaerae TaxID=598652 RepID=UPI0013EE76FF|nr:STAS domain-containing protein [Motilibacter rhizosphaerae]